MNVQVNVNLNGLEEKLHELGPKLAKSALRKALKAGAKILEDDAKSRAPVDTGALRESIKTKISMSPKNDRGSASVGPMFDLASLKKGSDKDKSQSPGVYGMIVEFGNKRQRASPFLRPAFDSKGEAVVAQFIKILADGLVEAAK
jgi:HK97 gp10 family phage protein